MWRLLTTLALVVSLSSAAAAQGARRVALVIGNGAYVRATTLPNPPRDAALIEAALRQAGFASISARTDLGISAFQAALRDFAAQARDADVALVYFAGHGLEADGQNWLVPTDARLATDTDLEFEAIRLESVLRAVEGARIRIVILDACRDNPFERTMRRFSPARAVSRGLAPIEADDVLVMYAAAAGQTATDGAGGNSPFAVALARRLPEPGLELRRMAGWVRDDVIAATGGQQRPFIAASLPGASLYLVPSTSGESAEVVAQRGEIERLRLERERALARQREAEEQAEALRRAPPQLVIKPEEGTERELRWAAIAVSTPDDDDVMNRVGWGSSNGADSQSRAENVAERECRSTNRGRCTARVSASSGCLALSYQAAGFLRRGGWGTAHASTRELAESAATAGCQRIAGGGGEDCRIVSAVCVQY